MHLHLGWLWSFFFFSGCDLEKHGHVTTNHKDMYSMCIKVYIYMCVMCICMMSMCVYLFDLFKLHFCRYMSRTDYWFLGFRIFFLPRWWRKPWFLRHQPREWRDVPGWYGCKEDLVIWVLVFHMFVSCSPLKFGKICFTQFDKQFFSNGQWVGKTHHLVVE